MRLLCAINERQRRTAAVRLRRNGIKPNRVVYARRVCVLRPDSEGVCYSGHEKTNIICKYDVCNGNSAGTLDAY